MAESESVYLLKIYYPHKEIPEEILGVIDYKGKMIRVIELLEQHEKHFKEIALINLNYVSKVEIIKKIGCIGDSDDDCRF